jgi:hypothetical protein
MRRAVTRIAVVVMASSLVACGAAKKAASPPVTTTTLPAATTTTTTVPQTVSGQLGQRLVTPPGFLPSTSTDVTNGPVDPAAFDKIIGKTGAAASLGFVGGYDETYDEVIGDDYVDVTLYQFATSTEAVVVRQEVVAASGMRTTRFAGIPGGLVAAPVDNGDGTFDHNVIAVKGSVILTVDYTGSMNATPPQLATIATTQYDAL